MVIKQRETVMDNALRVDNMLSELLKSVRFQWIESNYPEDDSKTGCTVLLLIFRNGRRISVDDVVGKPRKPALS